MVYAYPRLMGKQSHIAITRKTLVCIEQSKKVWLPLIGILIVRSKLVHSATLADP